MSKKTFSCGHAGLGIFCHRCSVATYIKLYVDQNREKLAKHFDVLWIFLVEIQRLKSMIARQKDESFDKLWESRNSFV